MKWAGKILKGLLTFPFNIITGMVVLAMLYHFFLFFAYDLNTDYLQIHNCRQVDGTWDAVAKRCVLRAQ